MVPRDDGKKFTKGEFNTQRLGGGLIEGKDFFTKESDIVKFAIAKYGVLEDDDDQQSESDVESTHQSADASGCFANDENLRAKKKHRK